MKILRSTALRTLARPAWRVGARSSQHSSKHQYSTAKDAVRSSSSWPWAVSAIILTGGGTYISLQPRGAASDTKEDIKQKLEEEKAALTKSLIKGERSGESVENHGIASEKNEHKIREGKFCDDEFDNHITKHSSDPGKDFEKVKKEKMRAEAK
ncbi:hypothetical protein E2P81_ATG03364 [Venturia nashicola]|nr:hypothetical protein E2P81_ATG03364 [Venturia nashicola]